MTCALFTPEELPIAEYHRHDSASKTTLDYVAQAPALLQWSREAPVDDGAERAVDFGDAFHALVLQPERFEDEFSIEFEPPPDAIITVDDMRAAIERQDEKPRGTAKAALQAQLLDLWPDAPVLDRLRKEWADALGLRGVVTRAEYQKAILMRDSIMAHPVARQLILRDGMVEHSAIWTDMTSGAACRCRWDKAMPESGYAWDLKTVGQIERFAASAQEYRYHVQDAHYSDGYEQAFGTKPRAFLFLAVSTTRNAGRYPVRVFSLHDDWKQDGRAERDRNLSVYAQCKNSGIWPGIETVSRPTWAK
jgi:hypothetical protein